MFRLYSIDKIITTKCKIRESRWRVIRIDVEVEEIAWRTCEVIGSNEVIRRLVDRWRGIDER